MDTEYYTQYYIRYQWITAKESVEMAGKFTLTSWIKFKAKALLKNVKIIELERKEAK